MGAPRGSSLPRRSSARAALRAGRPARRSRGPRTHGRRQSPTRPTAWRAGATTIPATIAAAAP
eukprot:6010327-Alexandrium_andersonii.AAC.1